MFGADFVRTFWYSGWPLVLLLFLLLVGLNVFYFDNRRLFLLLEREDWPALVQYLEHRIMKQGRYSSRLVRLLANTYLVLSDSASVISLENKVSIAKPALVEENALIFGAARILGKNYGGAVDFFAVQSRRRRHPDRDWLRWYHGFALLLDQQFSNAADLFCGLAGDSADGVVTGLSVFFLDDTLRRVVPNQGIAIAVEEGRKRVLAVLRTPAAWNREVSKIQAEVYVAIVYKYIKEAAAWLYGGRV
ncbi:MAG: hypothetical protein LBD78_09855 [Spirochaetaceae bacterium]|jgi:hypothetical protein|nr:hypothetical protein [Spirochaetaceae bacterium]